MDANLRAKHIGGLTTGQQQESKLTCRRLSGKARAEKLTPERRREIARAAAKAWWAGRSVSS